MSIKEYVSKKVLESKVKEQNLIHELVVINQLLVEAADKLQNEANKIPQLQHQIDQLQAELKQAQQELSHISSKSASALKQPSLDESGARIEKARLEAEQQKTISDFSEIMKERHISVPLQQETEYSFNKKFKEMIQSTIKIIP